MKRVSLLSLLLVFGCGVQTEESSEGWRLEPGADMAKTPEPPTPAPPTPAPTPTPTPVEPAACAFEPLWWQPKVQHRLTPMVFDFDPQESLLVRGTGDYGEGATSIRFRDEALPTVPMARSVLGHDAGWDRVLTLGYDPLMEGRRLRVRSMARGARVFDVDAGQIWSAAMSLNGRRVTAQRCLNDVSELLVWDVDTGQELVREELPHQSCVGYVASRLDLAISSDGNLIATTELTRTRREDTEAPRLSVFTSSGAGYQMRDVPIPRLPSDENLPMYHGLVSALAITPEGDVSVTSADGLRTVFDARTLEPLTTERRGAFISNQDTFLPPLPLSPIAWSPDGRHMASVNEEGDVEVRAGDVTLTRLQAPETDAFQGLGPNSPVALSFSPQGDKLVIGFRQGVGVWGCAPLQTQSTGWMQVSLDVLESIIVGEPAVFEVQTNGEARSDWVWFSLLVDGQHVSTYFWWDTISWTARDEEEHVIEVEVHDGWGAVRSEPLVIRALP